MIIMESLYRMAMTEGLDYYRPFILRTVKYAIVLSKKGHCQGVKYPDGGPWAKNDKKAKRLYIECLRDDAAYRSGEIVSNPLYEVPKYIFPTIVHGGKKSETKTLEMKRAFREKVQMIYDNTKDEAVRAVLFYLDRLASGKETLPSSIDPEKCDSDWFTFYYKPTDELVMYRPAVRDFWKSHFLQHDITGDHQCCVTGEMVKEVMSKYPKVIGLPGANGGGSPMVSTQNDSFMSYGLLSNENFPFSREVIEVLSIAMSRLCSYKFPAVGSCYPDHKQQDPLPVRSIRLDSNTIFCFWADSENALSFAENIPALLDVEPDDLKDQTWRRMWKGQMPSQPGDIGHHNCEYIYGMIFVGADRPMFQSMIMHPVLLFQQNLTQHFLDTRISKTATRKESIRNFAFSLYSLLSGCMPTKSEERQMPPPRLIASYTQAILDGTPYPFAIATLAEDRYTKEFHNTHNKHRSASGENKQKSTWIWRHRVDCCAAVIKGHLNRLIRLGKTTTDKEFTEDMDHTRTDPAYALGCALAIANGLQIAANGGEDPNKTIAEDLLLRCQNYPMQGYEKISEKVSHFIPKIRRIENTWGLYLTKLWHFWQSNTEGSLPQKFDIEQRHSFLLGFHQTFAWISSKELRCRWLNRDDVPEMLKPRGKEQKAVEKEDFEKEEDLDLSA